jgi:hypothetical protein
MRGCFLRGLGGESAGDFATKQLDAAPNITGSINQMTTSTYSTALTMTGAFSKTNNNSGNWAGGNGQASSAGKVNFDASISSDSYGRSSDEVRPINYAINWFIKF